MGGAFADAIRYFCDFENWIYFGLDALEFAGAVKSGDPLAEVVEGQRGVSKELLIINSGQ
jgi:hypothetical protein